MSRFRSVRNVFGNRQHAVGETAHECPIRPPVQTYTRCHSRLEQLLCDVTSQRAVLFVEKTALSR
jgi:hypothetical protein